MSNNSAADSYWAVPPERLLADLGGAPGGLSGAEALRRLQRLGHNTLEAGRPLSALRLLIGQVRSPLMLILVFAALVSAAVGEWVDASVILVIVIGSALLSFFQEYRATSAVERLRARVTVKATALRDGQPRAIPAQEVVPGDVVLLSAGGLIPADGVVLETRDCLVNQAALTGESFPVEKQPSLVGPDAGLVERTNCVFMGTSVRSGTARALIVRTGPATVYGQIARRLTLRPPETEFERGIRHFGGLLTQIMIGLVLMVFAINVFLNRPAVEALLFAIALAVGISPELLPAIISITLAHGAQDMAARGVIVRRLSAIENLGSMDVLCTDKTGTLTAGVVRLDAALDASGRPDDDVLRAAYLNATLQAGMTNPLDEAIAVEGRRRALDLSGYCKLDEIPYDFVRKRLSVVVQAGDTRDGAPTCINKGALGITALYVAAAELAKRRFYAWMDDTRV